MEVHLSLVICQIILTIAETHHVQEEIHLINSVSLLDSSEDNASQSLSHCPRREVRLADRVQLLRQLQIARHFPSRLSRATWFDSRVRSPWRATLIGI